MKKNFLAKQLVWLLTIVAIAAISLTLMAPPPPPPAGPPPSFATPSTPKLGGTPADPDKARAGLLGQITAGKTLKPVKTVVKGDSVGGQVVDPSTAPPAYSGKAGPTAAAPKPAGKGKIILDFDDDFPDNAWTPKQKLAINTAWASVPDAQKPELYANKPDLLRWAEGILANSAKKPTGGSQNPKAGGAPKLAMPPVVTPPAPSKPKHVTISLPDDNLGALTTSLAVLNKITSKPALPAKPKPKSPPPSPLPSPLSPAAPVPPEMPISIRGDWVNSTTIITWSKDNKKWLAGTSGQKWITENQKWLTTHNLGYVDSVIKKASAV